MLLRRLFRVAEYGRMPGCLLRLLTRCGRHLCLHYLLLGRDSFVLLLFINCQYLFFAAILSKLSATISSWFWYDTDRIYFHIIPDTSILSCKLFHLSKINFLHSTADWSCFNSTAVIQIMYILVIASRWISSCESEVIPFAVNKNRCFISFHTRNMSYIPNLLNAHMLFPIFTFY